MLILGGCAQDDVRPAPIVIDLEQRGRHQLFFTPRQQRDGVWPIIVVRDGRDHERAGGEHPTAPDLRLRLTVATRGHIVRDEQIDATRIRFGRNWQPPDTCLLLPPMSLDARASYRLTLTVVEPTHAFGTHPTTMTLAWGAE